MVDCKGQSPRLLEAPPKRQFDYDGGTIESKPWDLRSQEGKHNMMPTATNNRVSNKRSTPILQGGKVQVDVPSDKHSHIYTKATQHAHIYT